MDILFIGLTFGIVGKVMLGLSVILVHGKIAHDHRIDGPVLREMKRERNIAMVGIAFMVLGYFLELAAFDYVLPLVG